jgi:hypothetical protein
VPQPDRCEAATGPSRILNLTTETATFSPHWAMASRLVWIWILLLASAVSVSAFLSTTIFKSSSITGASLRGPIGRLQFARRNHGKTCGLKMAAEVSLDGLVEKIKATQPQSKRPDKLFKSIKKANGAPTVNEFGNCPTSRISRSSLQ